jgi:hypothetical protein
MNKILNIKAMEVDEGSNYKDKNIILPGESDRNGYSKNSRKEVSSVSLFYF